MRLVAAAAVLFAGAAVAAPPPETVGAPGKQAADLCTECHKALDDDRLRRPAELAEADIHHGQGVTCAGCHGGDPSAEDPSVAMDPARGFVGAIPPGEVPKRCGSCHSDVAFMLRYSPNIPTDQLAQYWTSRHGQALAKGDGRVATCTSCHGAHGVLPPSDARSPVYPTRIIDTCGRCHADAALMGAYGISGKELEEYQRSVHYAALVEKNDLSAPTCNDCHGSHGATPPGVSSVSNVCGTCHPTQREFFDASPHKDAFAGLELPACESCHSNHAVLHPEDAWIGVGERQVCGSCHAAGDLGAITATAIGTALGRTTSGLGAARERVARAERAGMLMEEAVVKLEEANQTLVLARDEVHTADSRRVDAKTAESLAAIAVAEQMAAAAEAELRYRRAGLFISLVVIATAMIALATKIRQIES